MGKITNIMLMLDYLNTGKKYTTKELATKIGISERMVRYYKQELESAGIYIDTFMGPNGGYFMLNSSNNYNHINKYDLELMKKVEETLEINNFEYIDKFTTLLLKLEHAYKIEEEKSKFSEIIDQEEQSITLKTLKKYINEKARIKIIYEDISGSRKERIIHPLQIFKFDKKIFITAYCELRNDIRHFELLRIKKIIKG